MFRPPFTAQGAQGERDFRWRGGDVSRLEGLSDAVFALALTLLVVTLEVPQTSAELREVFVQLPVFAVGFVLLLWIWHGHFRFHRRYGLEDPLTIALNGLLLFVVLLYVYPLRMMFTFLWNVILGRGGWVRDEVGRVVAGADGAPLPALESRSDGVLLMQLYGLGFAAIFLILTLLTARAWTRREALELDARERLITLNAIGEHLITASFGFLSVLACTLDADLLGASGMLYAGLGPAHGIYGWRRGRAVERLRPGGAGAQPPASPARKQ